MLRWSDKTIRLIGGDTRPRVVKVKSYTTKKGEKKKGHKRTKPDGTEENNHSYKTKKQK